MIILQGTALPEPCVVTIGKFEGIHRGHRAGIERVVQFAKTQRIKSAVVAFSPHPHAVLCGTSYSPLFTRIERLFLLEQLGVDYLLEYPFDAALMQMTAAQFCMVLFNNLQAEAVILGEGFRFGHKRMGTLSFLRETAKKCGRSVEAVPPVQNFDMAAPISTSTIRALLAQSGIPDLTQAARLLGFPFFAMGVVTQGRQLGRTMGFPTLNLYPPADKFLPRYGVYATQTMINGTLYNSISNIGQRPTVNEGAVAPTIETHLLGVAHDNNGNKKPPSAGGIQVDSLYGTKIRVDFIKFIRAEIKFDGLQALQNQIALDVTHVKDFYTTTSAPVSTP
ncbi:MAG: bifunctional riboflavin kinase/FMN adenylyltransferase [Defluviitaleaceae bacterium]|nr:bifunctional riboflavin kinase/FMN adenylyltransferase [Defluviitaleaceae bacterium]